MTRNNSRKLPEELVSVSQIAEIMNVTPQAVSNWLTRRHYPPYDSFPAPWHTWNSRFSLYVLSEVESWIRIKEAAQAAKNEDRIKHLEAELARLKGDTHD